LKVVASTGLNKTLGINYGLLSIRDLLFEVIATAQHKYVEEIAFWERPETQKLVNTAEKETKRPLRSLKNWTQRLGKGTNLALSHNIN
jgi:hypothetical protein